MELRGGSWLNFLKQNLMSSDKKKEYQESVQGRYVRFMLIGKNEKDFKENEKIVRAKFPFYETRISILPSDYESSESLVAYLNMINNIGKNLESKQQEQFKTAIQEQFTKLPLNIQDMVNKILRLPPIGKKEPPSLEPDLTQPDIKEYDPPEIEKWWLKSDGLSCYYAVRFAWLRTIKNIIDFQDNTLGNLVHTIYQAPSNKQPNINWVEFFKICDTKKSGFEDVSIPSWFETYIFSTAQVSHSIARSEGVIIRWSDLIWDPVTTIPHSKYIHLEISPKNPKNRAMDLIHPNSPFENITKDNKIYEPISVLLWYSIPHWISISKRTVKGEIKWVVFDDTNTKIPYPTSEPSLLYQRGIDVRYWIGGILYYIHDKPTTLSSRITRKRKSWFL
jgi:hypothetical protein